MKRTKPIIFISHIHENSEIALELSKFINDKFLGIFDVFVSSDGASIRAGDNWSGKIEEALNNSDLIIAIITEESLERKWIYFETGGAFFLGKRVIPVLCKNLKKEKLGVPLGWLQAIEGWNLTDSKLLFEEISNTFDLNLPDIDDTECIKIFNQDSVLPKSIPTNKSNSKVKFRKRVLPLFILVDASGSMVGEKIYLINKSLAKLIDELNQKEDAETILTLIQYNTEAKVIIETTPISQVNYIPDLEAGGSTNLGAAFNLLMNIFLKSNSFPSIVFKPHIINFTDGLPTDNWEKNIEHFRNSSRLAKHSMLYSVCLEDGIDEYYKKFSEIIKIDISKPDSINSLLSIFSWVSASIDVNSEKDIIDLPAPPDTIDLEF